MNILIAGVGGFIGSNLAADFLKEGHSVWGIDNFSTGTPCNLDQFEGNEKFTFKECGVETSEFLDFSRDAGVKFDLVFDLACPTGVPNIEYLGEEMLMACSVGIHNALKIASENNAKFLYTSSSEIYGDPEVSVQSESYAGNVDPLGWRANYEEGKRFGETWVSLYSKKYNLDAKIVRLFNVYGPNMSVADFRVIPKFSTQALSGEPITVHGDGLQERTLCYVDDLVSGLKLVIEKGKAGEVYNLGSDKSMTMLELAKEVIKIANSNSEIIFTPRASHDHQSRMPNLEKVKSLGWEQKIGLKEGLEKTLEYFSKKLPVQNKKENLTSSDMLV